MFRTPEFIFRNTDVYVQLWYGTSKLKIKIII